MTYMIIHKCSGIKVGILHFLFKISYTLDCVVQNTANQMVQSEIPNLLKLIISNWNQNKTLLYHFFFCFPENSSCLESSDFDSRTLINVYKESRLPKILYEHLDESTNYPWKTWMSRWTKRHKWPKWTSSFTQSF